MAKFTFLEVHLEGSSLTANAPFGADERDEAAEKASVDRGATSRPESVPEPDDENAEGGGRRGVGIVVGLVFLVAVALAVRKWRAEDEEIILG